MPREVEAPQAVLVVLVALLLLPAKRIVGRVGTSLDELIQTWPTHSGTEAING
jgi:hypothetical protein